MRRPLLITTNVRESAAGMSGAFVALGRSLPANAPHSDPDDNTPVEDAY